MTKLTKLEAGKTYVFKDEAAKQEYLNLSTNNNTFFNRHYRDGYCVDYVEIGYGWIDGDRVITTLELQYFKLKEEPMKNIKPEDEITITTTYGELARAYAVLGGVNGEHCGVSLWHKCADLLDPSYALYSKTICNKPTTEIWNYNHYQQEWLDALFPQETQQQKEARELREQAKALLEKAEQLEKSLKQ